MSKSSRLSSSSLPVATARLVGGSFAAMIGIGTVLLTLPGVTRAGQSLPLLDALFTATSAVCVTGLVVRDTATTFTPLGQWIILGLIQFGGLGYMTFASVVVLAIGRGLGLHERMQLLHSYEQPSLEAVPRIARNIVLITLAMEGIGALALAAHFVARGWYAPPDALFPALFHAVSAYCNAGFDVQGQLHGPFSSLTSYVRDVPVNLITIALFVVGGLGYPALSNLWQARGAVLGGLRRGPGTPAESWIGSPRRELFTAERFPRLSVHTKLVLLGSLALLAVGTVLILALEWTNEKTLAGLSPGTRVLAAFFQSATPRTAGFNTLALDQMRSSTIFVIGLLMFIGAAPGGTGGGLKVTTAMVLAAAAWTAIQGREEASAFGRRISAEVTQRALALLLLAGMFVVGMMLALAVTEPPALKAAQITTNVFMSIQFEVLSAFGTVGLSMGITPHLSAYGKALIILTMFVGRVGALTLAVGLAARRVPPVRYPEERVWVG